MVPNTKVCTFEWPGLYYATLFFLSLLRARGNLTTASPSPDAVRISRTTLVSYLFFDQPAASFYRRNIFKKKRDTSICREDLFNFELPFLGGAASLF